MHPKRKKKMIILLVILTALSAAVGLGLYAFSNQADYFYSPIKLTTGEAPSHKRIKVGGMVVVGSIQRNSQNLEVKFKITDNKATIPVVYTGMLPDLFKENSGVVAKGEYNEGVFYAEELLAKHDENYMPPEVKKALEAKHPNSTAKVDSFVK